MKQLLLVVLAVISLSCNAVGQKPTKADVTKVMKDKWEKEKTNTSPKTTITINDIKFGNSEKSNYAHQLEGIPKGALVTHAKIDFTETTFYTDQTRNVRRVMTAFVYKDQFGDWAVMNNGTKYIE